VNIEQIRVLDNGVGSSLLPVPHAMVVMGLYEGSGVSRVAVPSWPSFDRRNHLQSSFFHISHDFCSGKSLIGHLRMLLEVLVWVPVNSRKLGRIVILRSLDISDSQVICRNSQHWLTLWTAIGLFSIFISSPMMLWLFSCSGWGEYSPGITIFS
jgi:hypothetical protein